MTRAYTIRLACGHHIPVRRIRHVTIGTVIRCPKCKQPKAITSAHAYHGWNK